jgi:transcriptional regulator with XRE-family HTH domain
MSKPLAETVPAQLRVELARQDVTTAALARRLNVSQMWVYRRLRGKVPITLEDLDRFTAELDIEPTSLLSGLAA